MLVGLKLSLWIAQTMPVGLSYLMCVWLLLFFPIRALVVNVSDDS